MNPLTQWLKEDLKTAQMQEEKLEEVLNVLEQTIPHLNDFDLNDPEHRKRLYGASVAICDGLASQSDYNKYKNLGSYLLDLVSRLDRP